MDTTVYRTPELAVVAYTAGIIDGEGSIRQQYGNNLKGKGTGTIQVVQSIKNDGEYLCNWLKDQWGVGHVRRTEKGNNLVDHYVMFSWVVAARRDALHVLTVVEPYLIVKRKRAAEVIAQIQKSIDDKQRWTTWTQQEDDFLRENYQNMTNKELREALSRSSEAILNRGRTLGLTRKGGRGWRSYNDIVGGWTAEETEFLRNHYGSTLVVDIADHLGRTQASVTTKAERLGLTRKRGERRKLDRLQKGEL